LVFTLVVLFRQEWSWFAFFPCHYPITHSFFVTFFVPPWFCIFAKARTRWDALTFTKKQNAIPQNKKSAKKPIFPGKNHKIKERPINAPYGAKDFTDVPACRQAGALIRFV
jgi:hypothetical protein